MWLYQAFSLLHYFHHTFFHFPYFCATRKNMENGKMYDENVFRERRSRENAWRKKETTVRIKHSLPTLC